MPPKSGDTLELAIDTLAYGGQGIGRVDGFVVFVRGALPGDLAPRDAQDLMAYPFFSLAKTHRTTPIDFRMNEIAIRVEAVPEHGMATIWDADVLIWAASQIVEARDAGLRTSRLMAATPEFEQVAAFQAGGARLSVRREGTTNAARPLRSEYVTGNYFDTLGVKAFGGRVFTPADDRPSAPPVVVISHHCWQADYGADPSLVGSTLAIDGHPFTVAGVTPPGFFGDTLRGDPPDIWVPVHQEPTIAGDSTLLHQSIAAWLRVIGRLHPGASTAGMAPRLTGILRRWLQYDSGYPSDWMPDLIRELPKQSIAVVPAGSGVAEMKEEYGRSLRILMGVCVMVLLIACSNVANLLLVRAVARRRQTALRIAVGASRGQLVFQALLESTLLAVAGGIAGLVVSAAAARLLLALAFRNAHFLPISVVPSPAVLAAAFAVSLLTGILFGAAPAWFATRTDPVEALRGTGRGVADHSGFTRKALLVVQAALSVVLVAGATMLARSLDRLEHQDFGYRTDGRVVVSLNRPPATYTEPQLQTLYQRLEESLNRPWRERLGSCSVQPTDEQLG